MPPSDRSRALIGGWEVRQTVPQGTRGRSSGPHVYRAAAPVAAGVCWWVRHGDVSWCGNGDCVCVVGVWSRRHLWYLFALIVSVQYAASCGDVSIIPKWPSEIFHMVLSVQFDM